jgi:hypothetical protein
MCTGKKLVLPVTSDNRYLHGTYEINLTTPDHLDGRLTLPAVVSIFYPLGAAYSNHYSTKDFRAEIKCDELIPP